MTAPESAAAPRHPLGGPVSGASLGLGWLPIDPATSPTMLAVPEPDRYQVGGLIGWGGMGSVRAAYDRRLGRDVAVKTASSTSWDAERQLVAEAQLTARLVHPGIVAVLDAGCMADGRPYYTMPIVQGRSLAAAVAQTPRHERLRLVRHLLHACEAVGYAHCEGVVHRDLKPSNILVGRFGETIVVDWGLAGPSGADVCGVIGTDAYMPPEQRRGEPLGPTADVFALGMTLQAILAGLPNARGSARRATASAPAELRAIVRRATQAHPSDRYPDGRALARDVEAWFEGRRVTAHAYRVRELVARVWAAHHTALLAVALALVGIAVASAMAYARTSRAHALARASAQAAIAARDRAEENLARAEVAQAIVAMQDDAWAQAELLAADALTHAPSPAARGVLARFDRRARPTLVQQVALPNCARFAVSPDGASLACAQDGWVRVGELTADWPNLAALPTRGDPRSFAGDDAIAVQSATLGLVVQSVAVPHAHEADRFVLAPPGAHQLQANANAVSALSWSRGGSESWARLGTRDVQDTEVCVTQGRSMPTATGVRADGMRVALCQNGSVFAADGAEFHERLRLPNALGAPLTLVFAAPGSGLAAIGMAAGGAIVVDLDAGTIDRHFESPGTPLDLALSPSRLALSDSRGAVYVWDLPSGRLAVRLSAERALVRFVVTGLRVIEPGRARDWAIPPAARPHVIHTPSGIAAMSLSADGRALLTAHGDGVVRLWNAALGTAVAETSLHWSVVKDVEFAPGDRRAVATCAQDDRVHWIDLDDLSATHAQPAAAGVRVAWLRGDDALLAPYAGGVLALGDGPRLAPARAPTDPRVADMESDTDRRGLTLLDVEGSIVRIPAARLGEAHEVAARADATAVAANAGTIAVLRTHALELLQADGTSRAVIATDTPTTDVALSPDGRWVAVGHEDGTISIYSATLERLATLRGHSGRVSALLFAASGCTLLSGGWDGQVRQWSLDSLEVDGEALRDQAEARWGIRVQAVLDARAGAPT